MTNFVILSFFHVFLCFTLNVVIMKKLLVMFLSFIFVCIVNRSKMGWDNNSFSDCVAALGAFTVRKCPVF